MQKGAGILVKTLYVIYVAMVLFFCFVNISMPDLDLAEYFLGIRLDRIFHFIMFFPYPFIAWLTCNYSRHLRRVSKYSLLITFVSGLLLAFGTELCQDLFFAARQGDPLDWAADAVAVTLGTVIVAFIGRWMVSVVEKIFSSHKALTLLLTLFLFLCHSLSASAQSPGDVPSTREIRRAERNERLFGGEPVHTAVKLSAAVALGVVNPAVEFRVHKYLTVSLEAFGCFWPTGFPILNVPVTLGMAFLEGRYYPIEAFRGFFVGPNVGYGVFRMSKSIVPGYEGQYVGKYQVGSNFMAGFTIGYQFTVAKHWGIEISAGRGYQTTDYEGHEASDGSMYIGWNASSEVVLLYKAAVSVVYKW